MSGLTSYLKGLGSDIRDYALLRRVDWPPAPAAATGPLDTAVDVTVEVNSTSDAIIDLTPERDTRVGSSKSRSATD